MAGSTRLRRAKRAAPPSDDRLIVALDAPDLASALRLATRLRGVVTRVKVGSVLFTAAGPDAITRMRRLGFEVFVDLKFHDIPSTVEKSCRAAARHRAWMLTVHASGGRPMLEAAMRGVREESERRRLPRPLIVGVTVLTSSEEAGALRRVMALAEDARAAGLDGIVASAQEARAIRRRFGSSLALVCPGIRPASGERGDQRRVATPASALTDGAGYLVVGRPITEASDPRAAALSIVTEMMEVR